MGHAAEQHRRATYADLEAVPEGKVAELIDGQLYVFPRPAPPHLLTAAAVADEIRVPFHRGRGGPGGWWILPEPEIHFPDPAVPRGVHAVIPDLAGWRRERMPEMPETAYFPLAPDWVCEVLSPSTEDHDRKIKMPLYADSGVRWAWLVNPLARKLEVFVLRKDGGWSAPLEYRESARVRVAPFEALELDVAMLWAR